MSSCAPYTIGFHRNYIHLPAHPCANASWRLDGRDDGEARTHAIIQRWREVLLLSEAEVGWAVEEEREEEVERLLLLAGDRSRRPALD